MAIVADVTGDNEITITLGDTFDFSSADEFRNIYENVSEVTDGERDFVIDFRSTQYMDSSALGMLINMKKFWNEKSGTIRLINSNPQIRKLFVISHIEKKFVLD